MQMREFDINKTNCSNCERWQTNKYLDIFKRPRLVVKCVIRTNKTRTNSIVNEQTGWKKICKRKYDKLVNIFEKNKKLKPFGNKLC